MIELFENSIRDVSGSSKGNQLKWETQEVWYKSDYTGYEGLAEYAASSVLALSSLHNSGFVVYDTEQIRYKSVIYRGCRSRNMLMPGEQLITVERLIQQAKGESIGRALYGIEDHKERLRFLVDAVTSVTGLKDFGKYVSQMLMIDALLLNEDRHTHNIAVIRKKDESYRLCPFFDHGAGLLSDTAMDYPISEDVYDLIDSVKAKTICDDFGEAAELAEELYGQHIKFEYSNTVLETILDKEQIYSSEEKNRVKKVLLEQKRKYPYLFDPVLT